MSDPQPAWERFRPHSAIGHHLIGFPEVTSTMDVAWALAESSAAHGTAVLADVQTQGRGRFSRRWVAAPGTSLLLSVILRGEAVPLGPLSAVAAGLGVRAAVTRLAPIDCALKWPNDVLASGRKLGGILVELRTTGQEATAVIGVGLNLSLDVAAHDLLRDTATSVERESGVLVRPVDAADAVLDAIDATLEELRGGADPIPEWRASLATLGQHVTVHRRQGEITGFAEDVDSDGHLLLRTRGGILHVLAEGDVTLAG
jgi:BirA family biotin operon repressor/biotin-[acetyl-CoA-carboxylase] ligase